MNSSKKRTKNAALTAAAVSGAMLLSKLFGMIRDMLIAYLYGTESVNAIAFSTASRIPLLFFDIALGTAVTAAFIPIYNEFLQKGENEKAQDFSNKFITLISILTLAMVVLGSVFSDTVVKIIASGLDTEQLSLASKLVKILFPAIFITGVAYCFVGILQSDGEFLIPALISLVSNALLILYIIIFKNTFGVYGIAAAMLCGWILQIIIQIPSLIKLKYRLRIKNPFGDENIKRVCVLAVPIIVSAWVQPINTMININLASGLNNGAAVPALDYANKLYIILVGVFTYTITNLTFPSLSRYAAGGDMASFADVVQKSVKYVVFIIAPVMAGFMLLSKPIISVFYERGAFDASSTYLTARALFFYSMGMIGFGVNEVMNKAFYALQDGKTPMRTSVFGICINIALSLVFVLIFKSGLEGLAFSASVAANIIGFGLLFLLSKRVKKIFTRKFFVSLAKTAVSVIVMCAAVLAVKKFLPFENKYLSLVIPSFCGAAVYAVMCVVLKSEEFFNLLKAFAEKFLKEG